MHVASATIEMDVPLAFTRLVINTRRRKRIADLADMLQDIEKQREQRSGGRLKAMP